tara:strand:+ start:12644 stop:12856 length:213 start_codon:yes stop_codon:yes gene_type:complete
MLCLLFCRRAHTTERLGRPDAIEIRIAYIRIAKIRIALDVHEQKENCENEGGAAERINTPSCYSSDIKIL